MTHRIVALACLALVLPTALVAEAASVDGVTILTITGTTAPFTQVRLYEREHTPVMDNVFDAIDQSGVGIVILDDPGTGIFNGIQAHHVATVTTDRQGQFTWTGVIDHTRRDGTIDIYAALTFENGRVLMRDGYGAQPTPLGINEGTASKTYRGVVREIQPVAGTAALGSFGSRLDHQRMSSGVTFQYVCEPFDNMQMDNGDSVGDDCRYDTGSTRTLTGYHWADDVALGHFFLDKLTRATYALQEAGGAVPGQVQAVYPVQGAWWAGLYTHANNIYVSDSGGLNTLYHEYGHFVHHKLLGGIDTTDYVPNHYDCQNTSPATALAEGWADFFASAAERNFILTTEATRPACLKGTSDEGSVRHIFEDLADPAGNDPVDAEFRHLWTALARAGHMRDIADAAASWQLTYCANPAVANAVIDVATLNNADLGLAPITGCPSGGGGGGSDITDMPKLRMN